MNTITIENPHADPPRIRVNPNEKWIRHVHCEGARFHVISWGYSYLTGKAIDRCSEPDCIINKPEDQP